MLHTWLKNELYTHINADFIGGHIVDRLKELGWIPSYNSADSVRDTARVLIVTN